ncbi:MAG: flagellar export protein FliJ [Planctomycetota bacterium]|jgi:flagellar FliJ protein
MAKRFSFKLDPVLRHRKRAEEERLRDFAKAQADMLEKKQHLEGLAEQKQEHQDELVDLFAQHADYSSILDYQRYINSLDILSAYGRRELAQTEQVLEGERSKLLAARTQRRAIETLRERREEEHRKQADREEGKIIDEMAIQRRRGSGQLEE